MVSIRRRRYLGLCAGKSPLILDQPNENGKAVENPNRSNVSSNVKPSSLLPLPPVISHQLSPVSKSESKPGPSSVPKEDPSSQSSQYYPGKEIKRRKRHRRKQYNDQEPCVMRGVYFKNMKWQAAIKVDKKQIHLGTVASQDEAARLYDRAAFMCGREPNFELTEEDKEELRKFTWEDFLELTRNNINNKKQQRKFGGMRRKRMEMETQSDVGGSSQSDGTDPDAIAS